MNQKKFIPKKDLLNDILSSLIYQNNLLNAYWYLHFSPDKPPKTLGVEGKRQNTEKVSSLCLPQHRLLSRI